jgi:diguanylate cyclase (GGDEF)-like protein
VISGALLTLVVGVVYGWITPNLGIRVFWVSGAMLVYLLLIIGTLPALERVGIDRALVGYLRVVSVLFALVTLVRALAAIWPGDPLGLVAGSSILDPRVPTSAVFLTMLLVFFALLVTGLNMLVVARLVDSTLNLARRDVLTGTLNRLGLRHLIDGWEHRPERTISLLAIDIDHFKAVNDQYGHEVGDRVLQQVVQSIRRAMRPDDALIRMGGEEFLLIASERSPEAARELADRLLRTIAMPVRDLPLVTTSIGLVTRCETRRTRFRAALQRADAALYRAKREGRNRVCEAD